MASLSAREIFDLVRRHGAEDGVDRCAVAGALAESGGRTDAVGDNGHSIGLWQMHDQGIGKGFSVAQRADPDFAASIMVPIYGSWYLYGRDNLGHRDERLARYTCMYTERPEGFDDLYCPAADAYAAQWRGLAQLADEPPPPPPEEDLAAELAAEKAWGSALLAQLEGWADTIQEHLDQIQNVVNTMRANAKGE